MIPRFTRNGESSPAVWSSLQEADWPESVKTRFRKFLKELKKEHPGKLAAANYAEPRPYKNEYDRGTNKHSLVVTLGRSVFVQDWED